VSEHTTPARAVIRACEAAITLAVQGIVAAARENDREQINTLRREVTRLRDRLAELGHPE